MPSSIYNHCLLITIELSYVFCIDGLQCAEEKYVVRTSSLLFAIANYHAKNSVVIKFPFDLFCVYDNVYFSKCLQLLNLAPHW